MLIADAIGGPTARSLVRRSVATDPVSLAIALVAMVASAVLAAVGVRLSGDVVDQVASAPVRLALLAGGAMVLASIAWLIADFATARLAGRIGVMLQDLLVGHTLSLPPEFFARRSVGELADRVSTDIDTVTDGICDQLKPVVMAIVGAAVAFGAAFGVSPWLPVVFAVITLALAITTPRPMRLTAAASAELSQTWADAAGTAEEAIAARDDLRQTLGRGLLMRRWSGQAGLVWTRRRALASARVRLVMTTLGFVRLSQVVVLGGGIALVARGQASTGAVWAAFGLVALYSQRLEELVGNLPRLADSVASGGRVVELLAEPSEAPGPAAPSAVRWHEPVEVSFEAVTFAYDEGPSVLHRINLTVRGGRTCALVGRTGSGKSTLVKLVNRTLSVVDGRVRVGGVDVADIGLDELRSRVGYVTQRVEMVAASVADNVALFDPSISAARIADAFERLGLTAWIRHFPDGAATRVGPGGHPLTAGEEQLIAFARLLVRDPAVVVLDEATARLDPGTESMLAAATERLLAGRTAIIVAHRLATVANADDVVVLDAGRVVEHGRRAELAARPESIFAQLVEAGGGTPERDLVEPHEHRPPPRSTSQPVADRSSRPPPLGRLLLRMLDRHRRYGYPGMGMWWIYFALPAVGAWVWTQLFGALGSAEATRLVVIFAVAGAAGVVLRGGGEWFFSMWWMRTNLTFRSNLLGAQLHPHDTGVGGVMATPGETVSRMWDSDRLVSMADHLVDLVGVACYAALVIALTDDLGLAAWMLVPVVVTGVVGFGVRARVNRTAVAHIALRNQWAGLAAGMCAAAATIKGFAAEHYVAGHLRAQAGSVARAGVLRRDARTIVNGSPHIAAAAAKLGLLVALAASADTARTGTTLAASQAVDVMVIGGAVVAVTLIDLPAARAILDRMWRLVPDRSNFDLTSPPPDFALPPMPVAARPTRPAERQTLDSITLDQIEVVFADGTVGVSGVGFRVNRGELVIVTGPIASGKTTLLRVLAGLEAPTAGSIAWNGVSVSDHSSELRPPNVAYLAQAPRIVSGSIVENVTLDHDHDLDAALRQAELGPDVALMGGFDTLVGHRGLRLSGGQVQRIAAARAMASRPEVLVLDDLSSALDVLTERRLWQNLRTEGATVVATSYKRCALELADRIVVLHQGRVTAIGTLAELDRDHGHLFA